MLGGQTEQDEADTCLSPGEKRSCSWEGQYIFCRMMNTTALRNLWLALFEACWWTGI